MDSGGEMIAELQDAPLPPASGYSALVSNFTPDGNILERMADVGVDAFFAAANDLVVPSAGGWQIDRASGPPSIPPERIGCFGSGGNFPARIQAVHHLNFFQRTETTGFLVEALNGTPHGLPQINLSSPLPDSRSRRGISAVPVSALPTAATVPATAAVPAPRVTAVTTADHSIFSDALQLMLIAPRPNAEQPVVQNKRKTRKRTKAGDAAVELQPYQLLATYGGARIVEPFTARGGEAGKRWHEIIAMHERMKKYVDGESGSNAPTDDDLVKYGTVLFDTLFPREDSKTV